MLRLFLDGHIASLFEGIEGNECVNTKISGYGILKVKLQWLKQCQELNINE